VGASFTPYGLPDFGSAFLPAAMTGVGWLPPGHRLSPSAKQESAMQRLVALTLVIVFALCGLEAGVMAEVTIERDGDRIEIGNSCLVRSFSMEPCLTTIFVESCLTGRRFEVRGVEFVLDLGRGESIDSSDFSLQEIKPDPDAGRLEFVLRHQRTGITAVVGYELKPESFFVRKRLSLDTGSVYVRSVDVEHLSFVGAELAPMAADSLNVVPVEPVNDLRSRPRPAVWDIGIGQPVFVADQVFMGLEHPAGHNGYDENGVIFLRHYPGKAGRIECKSAVLGVAADGPHERIRDVFARYIEGIRARPVKRVTEFFFDTHVFDERTREIIDTAREVFTERGIELDVVTLNGWAEPREGIMEPPHVCPDLLGLTTSYTREQLGCPLGLHVYTSGCRSHLLRDWIGDNLDMIYVESGPRGRGAYCLADPRAEKALKANLARYVREHGVGMYYYDWGTFNCPAGNHRGHMPGYGTEAIADAFIRQLEAVRAVSPDIFLCDTGWFSPWWLKWYDSVYYGPGGDWNGSLDGPPSFATVDLLGSWRDSAMKGRLEARPYYPATGYINHGAISYHWQAWVKRAPQPRQSFVNYAAMMFLLGPQIAEYILTLPELSEANRDDLAAVHRWGIARDDWLLADTRPIGGDPMKGEVYGFAHIVDGNRGVIGIRNPAVLEQKVEFVCDEKAGFWPANEPFLVMETYPRVRAMAKAVRYGESIELDLSGHELRVLEVGQQCSLPRPAILGQNERLIESTPTRTVIALLGAHAGTAQVVSPVELAEVLLDGKLTAVTSDGREATIDLADKASEPPDVRIEDVTLDDSQPDVRLDFTSHVPEGMRASFVLLVTDISAGTARLNAVIKCSGKELDVEAPHIRLRDAAGRTSGLRAGAAGWNMFRVSLPIGRAEVECVIQTHAQREWDDGVPLPLGPWRARICAFVDAECGLAESHRIEIRHAPIKVKTRPTLPMHWSGIQRTRTTVLADHQVQGQPADGLRNLALATGPSPPQVEVDSLYRTYTTGPLNDGVVLTRGRAGMAWASAETPQEHSCTLTWPEKHRIGRLYICWGQTDWLPRAYRIECRVDGVFVPVLPTTASGQSWQAAERRDTLLRFDPVVTDALRVVQMSGGGSEKRPNLLGIAEIAAYE